MGDTLYVTAFKDIGRGSWNGWACQSTDFYLHAFGKLRDACERHARSLVVYTDAPDVVSSDYVTVKPYGSDTFLDTHIEGERRAMHSDVYRVAIERAKRTEFPEHVHPEYNLVNHNKVHFLLRAMTEEQPRPRHARYVWIDFHQARHSEDMRHFAAAGDLGHLPDDRITICCSRRLPDELPELTPLEIACETRDHFQGSVFVVPRDMVPALHDAYVEQLASNHANGVADDDQGIHRAVYHRLPSMYNVLFSPSFGHPFEVINNAHRFF